MNNLINTLTMEIIILMTVMVAIIFAVVTAYKHLREIKKELSEDMEALYLLTQLTLNYKDSKHDKELKQVIANTTGSHDPIIKTPNND